MKKSGTVEKSWLGIEHKGTQTTRLTADTRYVNSAMNGTWTTTNFSNTCGGITIFATSVMQMELKSTTGQWHEYRREHLVCLFVRTCA